MNIVDIKLHGHLKEKISGNFKFATDNLGEAMRSIELNSNRKFFKYLLEMDQKGCKYEVLVNQRKLKFEKPLNNINDKDLIKNIENSELMMKYENLETIDIVPVIEGGDDILGIILGVVLIIAGLTIPGIGFAFGAALVIGGLGLLAAGVINLLSKPPDFEDFREIDGQTGRTSYLFNGPTNTIREGGPVSLLYGRLLVGSQVIAANYNIKYKSAGFDPKTLPQLFVDVSDVANYVFYSYDKDGNLVGTIINPQNETLGSIEEGDWTNEPHYYWLDSADGKSGPKFYYTKPLGTISTVTADVAQSYKAFYGPPWSSSRFPKDPNLGNPNYVLSASLGRIAPYPEDELIQNYLKGSNSPYGYYDLGFQITNNKLRDKGGEIIYQYNMIYLHYDNNYKIVRQIYGYAFLFPGTDKTYNINIPANIDFIFGEKF